MRIASPCYLWSMNRISRSLVAVCVVTALFVAGGGVGPMSAKTINGCAIKVKTDCKSAKLKGANLSKANLKGANLDGVLGPINGTPLIPSKWILLNRYFIGSNANLTQANLFGDDLSGAKLSGADLTGADLGQADLTGADLTGADLSGAKLSGADLSGAKLSGADLTGADLGQADLTGADLSNTLLTGANLTGLVSGSIVGTPLSPAGWKLFNGYLVGPDANLSEAILTGIDLIGADLGQADLTGANLINANLTGADLTGADLTGVISYSVVGTPLLPEGWALLDGYLLGVFF